MLDEYQLEVLRDIIDVLDTPHSAQQALSHEQAPTLSMALPAFELMLTGLKVKRAKHPRLSHAIDAGIDKLKGYMQIARQNKVYALAMSPSYTLIFTFLISVTDCAPVSVINPTLKLDWIQEHWSHDEAKCAEDWIRGSVSSFLCRFPDRPKAESVNHMYR